MGRTTWAAALVAGALVAGCEAPLEPLPSLYDDPVLGPRLIDDDGFDGVSPRFGGFVHGEPAHYWSIPFGSATAMPVYRLCRVEGDEECAPLDHPPIVDRLPGEDGYSAYGWEHWVHLPADWSGRLASVTAVQEEIEALDLDAPMPRNRLWHCPIAALDARIDVGPDQTVGPEAPVYVRGMEARCFDFSATRERRALLPGGALFVRNVYLLTRADEALPLSEAMQMTDLTGDGDQVDSNNIFGAGLDDADYTPWWQLVRVTVPAGLPSIDTSGDETVAEYRDSLDMFDVAPDYTITPRAEQIVDHEITDVFINCPLQSAEGAL